MLERAAVLAVALLVFSAEPLLAIPAFARRYQVACHFCHDGFPKLTSTGQRFKERGLRMPDEEAFDLGKFARTVPLAMRATGTQFANEDADDPRSLFLKGISAGNLGRRLSYWVDDGLLWASGPGDDFTHTRLDNAWLRFEVVPNRLYVKGGRFELDLPFTQVRTPHIFSYQIYFANTGIETDTIGDYQDGVEVGGDLPRDVRWSAAVVAGRDPAGAEERDEEADRFDANVFLRLAKRINQHRVGGFAYIARNKLVPPSGQSFENSSFRVGADASAWIKRVNLYGVALYGRNDNAVPDLTGRLGGEQATSFSGGFLQSDWHLRDSLVLSLRGDLVRRPEGILGGPRQTFATLSPGVRFYVRERARLALEYGFGNRDQPGRGAVQVDLAF